MRLLKLYFQLQEAHNGVGCIRRDSESVSDPSAGTDQSYNNAILGFSISLSQALSISHIQYIAVNC